jgi:hypothetical protein
MSKQELAFNCSRHRSKQKKNKLYYSFFNKKIEGMERFKLIIKTCHRLNSQKINKNYKNDNCNEQENDLIAVFFFFSRKQNFFVLIS